MLLRGAAGNRGAVVIDAINLPAGSYNGDVPNSGAIRTGRGTNAVEWLTVSNSGSGGAGVIVHLSAASLNGIEENRARQGIRIGQICAARILENRANDGWNAFRLERKRPRLP